MSYSFIKTGDNGASNTSTFSFAPTNTGDLLILLSSTSAGGGGPTMSLTDNLSSVWTNIRPTTNIGSLQFCTAWFLPNCPPGITSLIATYAGGNPGTIAMGVLEYNGIAASAPLNANSIITTQTPGSAGTDAIITPAISVTSNPGLMFGWVIDNNNNTSLVAGSGFVGRQSTAMHNNGWVVQDARALANGSTSTTATDATHGVTDQYIIFSAMFLEPSGGAPLVSSARRIYVMP